MPPAKKAVMPASLRQKMAQATMGTRPSMLPHGVGGRVEEAIDKMIPKSDTEAPEINEIMEVGKDRTNLRKMIEQQVEFNSAIMDLKAQKEPYDKAIKALLEQYGITKMRCDGASVSYFVNTRKTIKGELLLASGIPQETIDSCTQTSNSKTLVIRPSKG